MAMAKQNSVENIEMFDPELDSLIKNAEKNYNPNSIQTFDEYKKLISLRIKRNFIEDFHVLRDGYTFIGNYNNILKERLKATPEIKNTLRDLVKVNSLIKEGKTFQEILKWSNEDILEIYSLAIDLLSNNHFYESSAILRLLCLVRPQCYFFWLKAGEALEGDNKQREALATYYGGLYANPYSIDIYKHMCTLLCKLKEHDKAKNMLQEALNMLEQSNDPELCKLKEEILNLQKNLLK